MDHPTKRALLDSAAKLAADEGMSAVTTQRVSRAAGVTKGAFLHYFPTRDSLVLAMFEEVLARFDYDIDTRMDADTNARGSFTRAYVASLFDDVANGNGAHWSAMASAMIGDDAARARWSAWVASREERHRTTDSDLAFQIIRLTADGVWYSSLTNVLPNDLSAIELKLIADASA